MFYGVAVASDVVATFQHKRESELRDCRRAIGRNVADGNTALGCGDGIDDIEAGCKHPDIFDIRAGVQNFLCDFHLVHDNRLIIADAFDNGVEVVGRPVVHGKLAEISEPVPRKVAGVFGKTVQNNDFHKFLHEKVLKVPEFAKTLLHFNCTLKSGRCKYSFSRKRQKRTIFLQNNRKKLSFYRTFLPFE